MRSSDASSMYAGKLFGNVNIDGTPKQHCVSHNDARVVQ